MTPFEQFKALYPRREAWKDAFKAWSQVDGDRHLDAILSALAWQVPMYRKREPHHVPLPASYLRGERWTDENPQADRAAHIEAERTEQRAWAERRNAIPDLAAERERLAKSKAS